METWTKTCEVTETAHVEVRDGRHFTLVYYAWSQPAVKIVEATQPGAEIMVSYDEIEVEQHADYESDVYCYLPLEVLSVALSKLGVGIGSS
jgi:hypothetical protein